jgi:hypothetical protein
MATKLTNVIIPENFASYIDKAPLDQNNFYKSGVMERTAYFDQLASQGGYTATMPYWGELDGDYVTRTDSDAGLPSFEKINTGVEVAIKCFDKIAVGTGSLVSELAGSNAAEAIYRKIGKKITTLDEKRLLATLTGVFESTDMANNILTVAEANFDNGAIVDAGQLLGDRQDNIVAIAMHSKLYAKFKKLNLVTNHATLVSDVTGAPIEFIGNKYVIVDDSLTDGTNTEAYLFKRGAVAYGRGGEEYPVEIGKLPHFEEEGITVRKNHIFHVRGTSWVGTAGLINASIELKKGTNWKLVYQPKEVGVVKIKVTP